MHVVCFYLDVSNSTDALAAGVQALAHRCWESLLSADSFCFSCRGMKWNALADLTASLLDSQAALVHASKLISYQTADALSAQREIPSPRGRWWFNASNFTRVPRDPDAFEKFLRNDSNTYPITAQVSEAEWHRRTASNRRLPTRPLLG